MMRLCANCTQARGRWQAVRYNPRRPAEWPGGQHILDGRTSHTERRHDWDHKTAAQIALIEDICARQHLTNRLLELEAA